MKTLFFDCAMGAAGDMLTAALLELCEDKSAFLEGINRALEGMAVVSAAPDKKCGIRGMHISVLIDGHEEGEHENRHHHHRSIKDIYALIDGLNLPQKVKLDARNVYEIIAQAESSVHGENIENVHFHEVGSVDALADVLGVCMLINEIKPEKIYASPVHVGSGTVRCAHGVLPVPAPATELILRGVPIYSRDIKGELCTPTGAALLKYFVDEFKELPVMCVEKTGIGTGKKDFEAANVVRAMLGESKGSSETILELRCNIDDMTPEMLGFAMDELFAKGALDVYFTNIGMKKCRPAVMLSCMCYENRKNAMLESIFKYTSTLGIREYVCSRYKLESEIYTKQTVYGAVRVKRASGWGVSREKPEYDDIARIMREHKLSPAELSDAIKEAE